MRNEFLNDLFGDQDGIVYSPTKEGGWKQHFFEWPNEKAKLESHVDDFNRFDVYISPVLFREKRIAPETFKGSNYLWTEFDGTIPPEPIEPTMRVMSSQEGHEHWYWKLDNFITDRVILEDLTRRIAYHYGADLSVWDYQNVLRPVDTWNHKRNRPVTLLSKTNKTYRVDDFLWVPIPPAGTRVDLKLGELPSRDEVLAKYRWKEDTLDLFFKTIQQGSRSSALARLAFDAVEAGCSNEEAYVLIEERDRAWGKYVGRTDREKQIKNCITHARSKRLAVAEVDLDKATEVYRFHDFMQTTIKLKWAVENLLPVAGSMVIMGKPGIGKSTFSLRLAMSLALGEEKYLEWAIINRQKTLFISLEMQHGELKQFFEDMNVPEEKQQELQDWFHIWPIGHAYPFDVMDQQLELLKYIDMHKIELIIIDSLSLSMYGSVKSDDDVKRLNSFLNEDVRKDRKCGYVFIHHLRKGGIEDNKKVYDLDDSFGSMYITANAQTVMLLTQKSGSPRLTIKFLKTRMAKGSREFDIERTPDRGFQIAGTSSLHVPITNESRETTGTEKATGGALGKLFDA